MLWHVVLEHAEAAGVPTMEWKMLYICNGHASVGNGFFVANATMVLAAALLITKPKSKAGPDTGPVEMAEGVAEMLKPEDIVAVVSVCKHYVCNTKPARTPDASMCFAHDALRACAHA